ncbi:Response regulator receiver protein, partial [human gut metagenome]
YNTIRMNCMSECFVSAGKKIEKAEDILGAYGRIELLIEKPFSLTSLRFSYKSLSTLEKINFTYILEISLSFS